MQEYINKLENRILELENQLQENKCAYVAKNLYLYFYKIESYDFGTEKFVGSLKSYYKRNNKYITKDIHDYVISISEYTTKISIPQIILNNINTDLITHYRTSLSNFIDITNYDNKVLLSDPCLMHKDEMEKCFHDRKFIIPYKKKSLLDIILRRNK